MCFVDSNSHYEALDANKPNKKKKALLYRQNRKVCAILGLGQQTNQGTTLINKYKSSNFPYGVVFTIVKAMRLKHTPKDMTAKIKMDADLEQLVFKKVKDFHTQVLSVMAKYKIQKSESECVELLAK